MASYFSPSQDRSTAHAVPQGVGDKNASPWHLLAEHMITKSIKSANIYWAPTKSNLSRKNTVEEQKRKKKILAILTSYSKGWYRQK